MFCPNCGSQNPDGAKFCAGCGTKLEDLIQMTGDQADRTQDPDPAPRSAQADGDTAQALQGAPKKPSADDVKNQMKKIPLIPVIIAAAVVVVIIIVIAILASSGKQSIDVTEDLDVSYSGANGYATAYLVDQYEWREEALELLTEQYDLGDLNLDDIDDLSDLSDAFSALLSNSSDYLEYYTYYELIYSSDLVTYEIEEPNENLSNGDTVTVTVTIDDDAEALPFKLKGSSTKTFTVSGLEDAQVLDVFTDIEVTFGGYAPYAYVETVSGDDTYENLGIYYTYVADDALDNGDTFIITAQYDEASLLDQGYVVESDTYTYTVSGVESYVTAASQITDTALAQMQAQADDVMAAHVASEWDEGEQIFKSKTYQGLYLLTTKSSDSVSMVNRVYLVYQVTANDPSNGNVTFYTAFYYNNLTVNENGDVTVDINSCTMVSNSFYLDDWSYRYYGYETLSSLESNCVTVYLGDYSSEKSFPETQSSSSSDSGTSSDSGSSDESGTTSDSGTSEESSSSSDSGSSSDDSADSSSGSSSESQADSSGDV